MAKKGVVIFDGEDMFINPKKAIYSKTRGEARNASFMSARGDDGPAEEESPSGDGPMGKERIMREGTSGGGSQAPSAPPASAPPIVNEPTIQQIQAEPQRKTAVEPDTITIKGPIAEIPTIVVPPILPPNYVAPTPDLPTRPTPPQRPGGRDAIDPITGGRYSGDENNPGSNQPPLFTIDDGTPPKQNIDTPRYVAPVPDLPSVPAAPVPPPAIVTPDPMGGGGSPVMGGPEIPTINCPTGFILNADTGRCVPTPGTSTTDTITTKKDPCAFPPVTPLVANHEWKKTGDCTWEQIPIPSTSTTDTTTTKSTSTDPCAGLAKPQLAQPPAGQKWVRKADCSYELVDDPNSKPDNIPDTTTSSTTTTTTKKSVNCNPPIYAPPKFYKWVDKGNCTFELAVDEKQVPNPSPAPVLPPTPGQPIININIPGGGVGTVPTLPTTPKLSEPMPSGDAGGGGGGGGGTPFPEEPAPIVEAPKKNYFWWYVGGALALYLILKRKKTQ